MSATTRALVIFLYFVVLTVWLSDFVLQLGFVSDASSVVRDAIVLIVWGGGLGAGLWLLRRGQGLESPTG